MKVGAPKYEPNFNPDRDLRQYGCRSVQWERAAVGSQISQPANPAMRDSEFGIYSCTRSMTFDQWAIALRMRVSSSPVPGFWMTAEMKP